MGDRGRKTGAEGVARSRLAHDRRRESQGCLRDMEAAELLAAAAVRNSRMVSVIVMAGQNTEGPEAGTRAVAAAGTVAESAAARAVPVHTVAGCIVPVPTVAVRTVPVWTASCYSPPPLGCIPWARPWQDSYFESPRWTCLGTT